VILAVGTVVDSSAITLAYIGLGATFVTALTTLGVAFINNRKTSVVKKTVDGTLRRLVDQVTQQEADKRHQDAVVSELEADIVALKERIGREP
jgi:hypothetical protein